MDWEVQDSLVMGLTSFLFGLLVWSGLQFSGDAPHRLGAPHLEAQMRTVEAITKLHNTQTTNRFVSQFTLHRGYRTNQPR